MGFTRSTTTTNVHSTLGDYPSVDDGLTPEQLKARFDAPATGLKGDINNLETELEATTAAANIGAAPITTGDTSQANMQAKLSKIYQDIQNIEMGYVADGSVGPEKLTDNFLASIAVKDGTLQTNLNADKLGSKASSVYAVKDNTLQTNLNAQKLGGSTKAQIINEIIGRQSASDTTYNITLTTTESSSTKTLNTTSRYLLLFTDLYYTNPDYSTASLYDCRSNQLLITLNYTVNTSAHPWTFGFFKSSVSPYYKPNSGYAYGTVDGFNYSNGVLSFNMHGYVTDSSTQNLKLGVKIVQLDGLLP